MKKGQCLALEMIPGDAHSVGIRGRVRDEGVVDVRKELGADAFTHFHTIEKAHSAGGHLHTRQQHHEHHVLKRDEQGKGL